MTEREFLRGGCYALAIWLHQRTGLQLVGLYDEDGTLHHAMVANDAADMVYDARGAVPVQVASLLRGRRCAGTILKPASTADVMKLASVCEPVSQRAISAFVRKVPGLSALLG